MRALATISLLALAHGFEPVFFGWIHQKDAIDNWQTSAWERNPRKVAEAVAHACQQAKGAKSKIVAQ